MWKNWFDLPTTSVVTALSLGGLAIVFVFLYASDHELPVPRELAHTDQSVPLIPISVLGRAGVIFPESRAKETYLSPKEGYWTPTTTDVEGLESELRGYLNDVRSDYYLPGAPQLILAYLPRFRCQYVGFKEGGSRKIFVNCLFEPDDSFLWQRRFVRVSDGGWHFWYAVYDADGKKFTSLSMNGEA